jgi:hypothetical protein
MMAGTSSLGPQGREAVRGDRPEKAPILPPLSRVGRLRLATETLSLYVAVRWRLWRSDVKGTVDALRGVDRQWRDAGLETYWQGVRLAKATTRTLRILPTDSRCLMKSLVLLGLLSRRGIGATLIVAVKAEPAFAAHAWIEHDHRPLLPAGEYGRLVEL